MERIRTGVEGLDEILSGGFPKESITLVSGPPGSGKSIFCYQFINQGVNEGKRCLLVTLDRKVDKIITQAEELGFPFRASVDSGMLKILYVDTNKRSTYDTILREILNGGYERIVIDSITPLIEMPVHLKDTVSSDGIDFIDPAEFNNLDTDITLKRFHLKYIIDAIESAGGTALITSEAPFDSSGVSRDTISEFLADGVIFLNYDPAMDRRKLTVIKMRNTPHTLKTQSIGIGEGGLRLLR